MALATYEPVRAAAEREKETSSAETAVEMNLRAYHLLVAGKAEGLLNVVCEMGECAHKVRK